MYTRRRSYRSVEFVGMWDSIRKISIDSEFTNTFGCHWVKKLRTNRACAMIADETINRICHDNNNNTRENNHCLMHLGDPVVTGLQLPGGFGTPTDVCFTSVTIIVLLTIIN